MVVLCCLTVMIQWVGNLCHSFHSDTERCAASRTTGRHLHQVAVTCYCSASSWHCHKDAPPERGGIWQSELSASRPRELSSTITVTRHHMPLMSTKKKAIRLQVLDNLAVRRAACSPPHADLGRAANYQDLDRPAQNGGTHSHEPTARINTT